MIRRGLDTVRWTVAQQLSSGLPPTLVRPVLSVRRILVPCLFGVVTQRSSGRKMTGSLRNRQVSLPQVVKKSPAIIVLVRLLIIVRHLLVSEAMGIPANLSFRLVVRLLRKVLRILLARSVICNLVRLANLAIRRLGCAQTRDYEPVIEMLRKLRCLLCLVAKVMLGTRLRLFRVSRPR